MYRYGSHKWLLNPSGKLWIELIIDGTWYYRGRYTGDGIWGCGFAIIGAILGISAGSVNDYNTFRSLYIAQSVFVSED